MEIENLNDFLIQEETNNEESSLSFEEGQVYTSENNVCDCGCNEFSPSSNLKYELQCVQCGTKFNSDYSIYQGLQFCEKCDTILRSFDGQIGEYK